MNGIFNIGFMSDILLLSMLYLLYIHNLIAFNLVKLHLVNGSILVKLFFSNY
jgi:hypothetical protein